MHFDLELPSSIAPGISRGSDLKVEIVPTVGGREVRNKLWGEPLRTWEVPFPNMHHRDNPDFAAIGELWATVEGSTHTFNFNDELADEMVRVRFDGKLTAVHEAGPYWRYETIMLVEVRREDA